jgi:hypothetical protein
VARNVLGAIEIVPAIAVGTGVGGAVSGAIAPVVQQLQNDAWSLHAVKPVAAGLVAQGVAQGQVDYAAGAAWAKQQGYDSAQFDAMIAVADTGPGLGQAFRLWRRDLINDAGFRRAAKRLGIEEEWLDALEKTRQEPLDPAVIAAAIVRGLIPDPGILPVGPPAGVGKVPRFPVFAVDAVEDAKWAGVDLERLSVMVGNYGRPMSPEAAAFATYKGIIERVDFDRAVAEGDVRNEWADAIFENSRFVLSPQDAAGLRLRGWKTRAEAQAIGDLHGASAETMDDLFLNRGRPATVHQVHIGFARGGRHPDVGDDEKETVRKAVQQSDIRPEWFDLLWAQRYTMPSAFVLRALTQDGTFTEAEAENILLESGWRPDLAKLAATKWAGGGVTAGSKWADRARTQAWGTIHSSYIADEIAAFEAETALESLGVPAGEVALVVGFWNIERALTRKQLTPAQIKAAFKKSVYDRQTAINELVGRGYDGADAATYLDS